VISLNQQDSSLTTLADFDKSGKLVIAGFIEVQRKSLITSKVNYTKFKTKTTGGDGLRTD
jgi:hypothetical protein